MYVGVLICFVSIRNLRLGRGLSLLALLPVVRVVTESQQTTATVDAQAVSYDRMTHQSNASIVLS